MRRGLIAEFESPERLLDAVRTLRARGCTALEAYTPYPLAALDGALGLEKTVIPKLAFIGGAIGCVFAYLLQWWTNAVDDPLNVGGFPPHAPPSFIPITFETTILFAALAAFFGAFVLMKRPQLADPIFNVPGFERASIDRFFLAVGDENGPRQDARAHLLALKPLRIEVFEEGSP